MEIDSMDYRFTATLIILMLLMALFGGPTQWINLLKDEIYITNKPMFIFRKPMFSTNRN